MDAHDRAYNRSHGTIRSTVERTIAKVKSWRALKTRYRGRLPLFEDIVTIIVGLMFYHSLKTYE